MKELRIPVSPCLPRALPGAVSARSAPTPAKSFALVPGPDSTAGSCHPSSLPWPRAALRPVLWVHDFYFFFCCVFVLFFPANVYILLLFLLLAKTGRKPCRSVGTRAVCAVCARHSAGPLPARGLCQPVTCQSYDSAPRVLIAVAGQGEERSLLPFNGHLFLAIFPPFSARCGPTGGVAALTAPLSRHRVRDLLALQEDGGAFPRRLKCKVLQPSHAC